MYLRIRLFIALISFFSFSIRAEEPVKGEVHTKAGQEVLARNHVYYNSNTCQALTLPKITIVHQPDHGHLDIREGNLTVGTNLHGAGGCTGMIAHGLGIFYIPAEDFHGIDTFSYDVRYGIHPPDVHLEWTATVE